MIMLSSLKSEWRRLTDTFCRDTAAQPSDGLGKGEGIQQISDCRPAL
jgi:hypothetical protein